MPFADELLGTPAAAAMVRALESAGSPVLTRTAAVGADMGELALGARASALAAALLDDIPGDLEALAGPLRRALDSAVPPLSGWSIWAVGNAVSARAISDGTDAAFDEGLLLLTRLTGRLTAEWSIRPLLEHDLARALPQVAAWTDSPDEHVRRLASEGTRPFLPWGTRVRALQADPTVTVPILDALYRDDSDYVRRSVANHLNDLSRTHADEVVGIAARWLAQPDENTAWVVKHALRTLIKKGHPGALLLLGFAPPAQITVDGPQLMNGSVTLGGTLDFAATVTNTGDQEATLVIDYVVHHVKANGTLAPKTFKLRTVTLAPGRSATLTKAHSIVPITTRRYYGGEHHLELQVNGVGFGRLPFQLVVP